MGDFADFNPLQYTLLNWIVFVPAVLVTVLRLVVRYRQVRTLYLDDVFAILGAASLTVMAALTETLRDGVFVMVSLPSITRPSSELTESVRGIVVSQSKQQFVFMIFFWTCLWSAKASLLMFYRRLFVGVRGYMRWWWAVVIFCVLTYLASILTNFLICLPLKKRFSLAATTQCPIDTAIDVLRIATALDVITDVLVMILPIGLLFGLRISTQQKIGIGCIFSLGLIVIIFSIVRLLKLVPLIQSRNAAALVSLVLWSMVESAVAVIIASLPPLKSLVSSRKHDSRYSHGNQPTLGSGRTLKTSSRAAIGESIKLYHVSTSIQSDIRGGFDSEEELNRPCTSMPGISRRQDIQVTYEAEREHADDGITKSLQNA